MECLELLVELTSRLLGTIGVFAAKVIAETSTKKGSRV